MWSFNMKEEEFEFPMIPSKRNRRKLAYGVGVNDAWYKTQPLVEGKKYQCPYYKRWNSMIERGYSHRFKEKHPTYKDVTVCEEWHTFSNFRSWMEKQDWVGKQLDKDIILPDNKVYSPETCVFVSSKVNKLLTDSGKSRGRYKQGVYLERGRFRSQCNNGTRKSKNLGLFPTEQLAYEAYVNYKYTLILQVASEQEDERVKNGLLLHADILLKTLDEEQQRAEKKAELEKAILDAEEKIKTAKEALGKL